MALDNCGFIEGVNANAGDVEWVKHSATTF